MAEQENGSSPLAGRWPGSVTGGRRWWSRRCSAGRSGSVTCPARSPGSPRRKPPGTPRAAPFSRPAGTARPATTWSTTSPATPRSATCNAGTGRSPAHVAVTGEQSPYAEVAAAGELHDGGVVAGELGRPADAVDRAGDPEPVQLAEEMARAAELPIRVQDREAAERAVENERSRRRQQHVGGGARVVADDLSRRAGPACPWRSRGRRRPGG